MRVGNVLSLIGMEVSAWTAAILSLTLFSAAFLHDIWRGCIESLPKGQWEACRTLGQDKPIEMSALFTNIDNLLCSPQQKRA